MRKRLLLLVNDAGFFVSHRLPLALGARDCGFDVHVATAPGAATAIIESHGITHHPLPLSRSGTNPLGELRVFAEIARLIHRLKPDILHLVTVKPVLYGGVAARLLNVPGVVAAISGLGHVFITNNLRTRFLRLFVKAAYRIALRRPRLKVIFQNDSDRDALMEIGAVSREDSVIVRGSGVDLTKYRYTQEPDGVPVVTFAARLLRQKGVFEFVAAASLLRAQGMRAKYRLVGDADPGNVSSVTAEELQEWRREGVVEVLGYRSDIAELFAASNLIVLPSYREGLPKVLVEAAACGRAVVTTDTPGCRDAVEPGKTAVLVKPRDAESLASGISSLLNDPVRRRQMGAAGRVLAEREYAIEDIVKRHLDIYRSFG